MLIGVLMLKVVDLIDVKFKEFFGYVKYVNINLKNVIVDFMFVLRIYVFGMKIIFWIVCFCDEVFLFLKVGVDGIVIDFFDYVLKKVC